MSSTAEPQADETVQERILSAAFDVFMAEGFSGATTDMIQLKSGSSKSTIYRHFPSKEILFSASIVTGTNDFLRQIETIHQHYVDIGSYLTNYGHRFLDQLLSRRGISVCRLMIAESQRFPHLGRVFYKNGPYRVVAVVESHLLHAHNRGEISVASPADAAECFIGMIRGDIHLRVLLGGKRPSKAQQQEHVASIVRQFLSIDHGVERGAASRANRLLKKSVAALDSA